MVGRRPAASACAALRSRRFVATIALSDRCGRVSGALAVVRALHLSAGAVRLGGDMLTMEDLVREADAKNASDLHLSAGGPPRVRVDGDLVATDHPALDAAGVQALVETIMTAEQREHFAAEHELDFSWAVPDVGRYRVNVFMQGRGPGAVLRAIPTKIPSFEALSLPPMLAELCKRERGLILVTGPTGSGKSTTLAAMVDVVNETWDGHI